ncbi:uncharacterized protein LOC144141463 [Haemaphysalis longicornis]
MATVSYFRVQYDTFTTVHLIRQLRENHNVLSETSRGQFLDDLVTLAVKGVVPMEDLTTCLPYLQREGSCMVWLLYQMASAKALKQFAGRTEYKPFYEQNQAICMVLRLQPPVEPCLKVTQNEVCCAFDMCTLDTDAARSVSTNANSDGPNLT